MRYLMLVRVPADAAPAPDEADPGAWYAEAVRRGQHLGGERLHPPSTATTVRAWEGAPTVAHGPFAEVAEQVAGFDLLEVGSEDEAVEVAAGHPVARFGALELRRLTRHLDDGVVALPGDGDLLSGPATYLLIMAAVPGAPEPRPEGTDGLPTTRDWVERMRECDADRGGSPLRPATEALTVRVRGGETLVTHGPFAELAEQVAGYNLLDVPDLDAAIDAAGTHPAARHGVVEIRPLWPI